MDCLHDLGDPVGALARCRKALKPDGKVLLVEPYAGDRLEENLNPIGRMYYAASAMACTPNSLSQEVGLGLGAQAGEERLRRVAREAGLFQPATRRADAGQSDPRTDALSGAVWQRKSSAHPRTRAGRHPPRRRLWGMLFELSRGDGEDRSAHVG